jgi:L-ascorbate metabolism protein UlaG (beta-lactamase superfamily)
VIDWVKARCAVEACQKAREGIDEIDVLFVPIGGQCVLTSAEAHTLAISLEPKIIIPMHWATTGDEKGATSVLEAFLKESGNGSEQLEKLTLKKKDLTGRDGSILVLTP